MGVDVGDFLFLSNCDGWTGTLSCLSVEDVDAVVEFFVLLLESLRTLCWCCMKLR